MSFHNHYPNRKDHRKPYTKAKRIDPTCRNGGACTWCRGNRTYGSVKREMAALDDLRHRDEDDLTRDQGDVPA